MLLAPLSSLEFPSWRAPGFDPSHLAAGTTARMSCVASTGGAFINLLNGQATTPTNGTPTSTIRGVIGPAVLDSASTVYNAISNSITETPVATTFGAIFIPTAASGNQTIVADQTSPTGNYSEFRLNGGVLSSGQGGGGGTSSGFPSVVANQPYFVACSLHSANQNFVLVNLLTGQTWSASTTTSRPFGSISGSYAVGGFSGASTQANAYIAAAMMSRAFLGADQLLAWAADPWAFWYPDDDLDHRIIGALSGALSFAGLSPSRFRAQSAFSGAQTMGALGGARARSQGASTQVTAVAARSSSTNEVRSAQSLAAAFAAASRTAAGSKNAAALAAAVSAASSARGPSRLAASLAASVAGRARAIASARGAEGTGAFLSATGSLRLNAFARGVLSLGAALSGRSSAGTRARTSPALAASVSARTRAAAGVRGVFSSGAFLYVTSGLAKASLRAEAAILATVHLVINPALVLKAPATIRSLAAPATTRLLKAISTIRNLKAP